MLKKDLISYIDYILIYFNPKQSISKKRSVSSTSLNSEEDSLIHSKLQPNANLLTLRIKETTLDYGSSSCFQNSKTRIHLSPYYKTA